MGSSLFDELRKSGLVDEKKAKQVKREKRRRAKQHKDKQPGQADDSKLRARQARAEKAVRDRELNEQRKQAAEQKAMAAQVAQLIEKNRIEDTDGEIGFNFVERKKVRRIFVTETLQDQLARGTLAIVRLEGRYDLVPSSVAEKIRLRDPSCVVHCGVTDSEAPDADDPYAQYQVPDDLMW